MTTLTRLTKITNELDALEAQYRQAAGTTARAGHEEFGRAIADCLITELRLKELQAEINDVKPTRRAGPVQRAWLWIQKRIRRYA